jgi:undecaprenyl pyrophosphate phosphatase UppP
MPTDPEHVPGVPAPHDRPNPGGTARGWRSGGFALIVTGVAGLLFHLNEDVPILQSHLGQIAIGLIVLGIALCVAGIVTRTAYHRRRMSEGA